MNPFKGIRGDLNDSTVKVTIGKIHNEGNSTDKWPTVSSTNCKKKERIQIWWCVPVVPLLRSLRWKDHLSPEI
jgi:hypothetical protein